MMNYEELLKKDEQMQELPAEEQKRFYPECLQGEQPLTTAWVHVSYR